MTIIYCDKCSVKIEGDFVTDPFTSAPYCPKCATQIPTISNGAGIQRAAAQISSRRPPANPKTPASGVHTAVAVPVKHPQQPPPAFTKAGGNMAFYFCESCGRRINVIDLEEGRARDKQLKGIYCTDCWSGVNTMSFDAITLEEANAICREEAPTTKATTAGAIAAEYQARSRQSPLNNRRKTAAITQWLLASALFVVVLTLLFLIFPRRRAEDYASLDKNTVSQPNLALPESGANRKNTADISTAVVPIPANKPVQSEPALSEIPKLPVSNTKQAEQDFTITQPRNSPAKNSEESRVAQPIVKEPVEDTFAKRLRDSQPQTNGTQTMMLDLGNGVKIEFAYIKPGTFVMGGKKSTEGRFSAVEIPKHSVTITRGFYLGKYEVTQAQFQAVMGTNPSKSTRDPQCPADCVSWEQANAFCKRVSERTGRDARLPREAEWEYACRAGSDSDWTLGTDESSLGAYAWTSENSSGKSHPVGQKKPNPWGLHDMYGNVSERVADMYQRDFYASSPKEDPIGAKVPFQIGANGTSILRGGDWKSMSADCYSGARLRGGGYGVYDNWGFRVAVTASENEISDK